MKKSLPLFLLLGWCFVANATYHLTNFVPPNVDLGRGYNSLLGLEYQKDRGICVKKSVGFSAPANTDKGAISEFKYESFKSEIELSRMFNRFINTDATLKIFDEKGLSLEKKITEEIFSKTGKNYTFAIIEFTRVYQWKNLDNFELKENITETFNDNLSGFIRACGDEFISSVKLGAKVIALLQCETNNKYAKYKIDKILDGKVDSTFLSANDHLQKKLEVIGEKKEAFCEISVFTAGGEGSISLDPENFVSSSIAYTQSITPENSIVLDFATTSYESIIDKSFQDEIWTKINDKLKKAQDFVIEQRKMIEFSFRHLNSLKIQALFGGKENRTTHVNKTLEQIRTLTDRIERCGKRPLEEQNCKVPNLYGDIPLEAFLNGAF